MYANFYYHIPSKSYGRGPWLDTTIDVFGPLDTDTLGDNPDCLYIGEVYDQKLFPNEMVIE